MLDIKWSDFTPAVIDSYPWDIPLLISTNQGVLLSYINPLDGKVYVEGSSVPLNFSVIKKYLPYKKVIPSAFAIFYKDIWVPTSQYHIDNFKELETEENENKKEFPHVGDIKSFQKSLRNMVIQLANDIAKIGTSENSRTPIFSTWFPVERGCLADIGNGIAIVFYNKNDKHVFYELTPIMDERMMCLFSDCYYMILPEQLP